LGPAPRLQDAEWQSAAFSGSQSNSPFFLTTRTIRRTRAEIGISFPLNPVTLFSHNAAILLRLADAGWRSSDPATAEAAEKLVDNAIRLSLYVFYVTARLYLGMILPGARISRFA
jgi:hypothetical protein